MHERVAIPDINSEHAVLQVPCQLHVLLNVFISQRPINIEYPSKSTPQVAFNLSLQKVLHAHLDNAALILSTKDTDLRMNFCEVEELEGDKDLRGEGLSIHWHLEGSFQCYELESQGACLQGITKLQFQTRL